MLVFTCSTINQVQCATLAIRDDANTEGTETFTLNLTAVQSPLSVNPERSMATVTILDLDSELFASKS